MIIEIESVYGDKLLHGKRMTLSEMNILMQNILEVADEKNFHSVFIVRTGCEEIIYTSGVLVDFVIDLDTHNIYKPSY